MRSASRTSEARPGPHLAGASRLRPVVFQHLRKTGGTSIVDTLKLFFRSERTISSDSATCRRSALPTENDFDFIFGHTELLSWTPPQAFTFAVFRDPLRRLMSERRQYMQAGSENLRAEGPETQAAILALRDKPLARILPEMFSHPVLASIWWNHQATMLGVWPLVDEQLPRRDTGDYRYDKLWYRFSSGEGLRAWLLANRSEILARAMAALDTLDYVGLTEELDASVCEIFARIGLPEPGRVVRRNVREPFEDEDDPDLPVIAAEFLELDYELYDAARERYALQRRVARGSPVDYIGRWLPIEGTLVVSAYEAPGGHGWYPAHFREDGVWSRWTGPDLESRFALSAMPGRYRLEMTVFGAASGRSLYEAQIEIEGKPLDIAFAQNAAGLYVASAAFERSAPGRFDLLFRFPDVGSEYGLEVKELSFSALKEA